MTKILARRTAAGVPVGKTAVCVECVRDQPSHILVKLWAPDTTTGWIDCSESLACQICGAMA